MPVVNIQRLADGNLALAAQERAVALPPGWTIQDVPDGWLAGSADGPEQVQGYLQLVAPAVPNLAGLSLGSQVPPQVSEAPGTPQQTTGPETQPLCSYALPPGKFSIVDATVFAWLPTSTTAFGYSNTALLAMARNGNGAPFAPIGYGSAGLYGNASPALPFQASGLQGSIAWVVSGNVATLYGAGFNVPSAWSAGTFVPGSLVTKGGNVYACISIAGTGTSTAGPSGTGLTTDNAGADQVVWDCVTVGGTTVLVRWCANLTAVYSI